MIKENKNKEAAFERFRDFAKKIISVPKAEIDRRETEYKKARAKSPMTISLPVPPVPRPRLLRCAVFMLRAFPPM
jgi:hypothetical protein